MRPPLGQRRDVGVEPSPVGQPRQRVRQRGVGVLGRHPPEAFLVKRHPDALHIAMAHLARGVVTQSQPGPLRDEGRGMVTPSGQRERPEPVRLGRADHVGVGTDLIEQQQGPVGIRLGDRVAHRDQDGQLVERPVRRFGQPRDPLGRHAERAQPGGRVLEECGVHLGEFEVGPLTERHDRLEAAHTLRGRAALVFGDGRPDLRLEAGADRRRQPGPRAHAATTEHGVHGVGVEAHHRIGDREIVPGVRGRHRLLDHPADRPLAPHDAGQRGVQRAIQVRDDSGQHGVLARQAGMRAAAP